MLGVSNATTTDSIPSLQVDQPRTQVALERLGTAIGSYIGSKTNDMLSVIPGASWAINQINIRYSSIDSQDIHFLETIKKLQSVLDSIYSECNLTSTPDFESRVQAAQSKTEAVEIYKAEIETQLKHMIQPVSISEQSNPDPLILSPSTDQLPTNSPLEHSRDDQSVHSTTSAAVSPSIDESDPEVDKRYEELHILFDLLEAVCFNNFSRLEEKHWIKLEALVEKFKAEQRIEAGPLAQVESTQVSVDLRAANEAV